MPWTSADDTARLPKALSSVLSIGIGMFIGLSLAVMGKYLFPTNWSDRPLIPFSFQRGPQEQILKADPEKAAIVRQMFQVYIEARSDFAVRDWLKQRQIPSSKGSLIWTVGTIRNLLSNRRYIGELEINKSNKKKHEVGELEAYRILKGVQEAIVPRRFGSWRKRFASGRRSNFPTAPAPDAGRGAPTVGARISVFIRCKGC